MATEGHELIAKLLHTFQVYKSTGAVELARKLYAKYSQVSPEFLKLRETIVHKKKEDSSYLRLHENIRKKPEFLENNGTQSLAQSQCTSDLVLDDAQSSIDVLHYPKSFAGIIDSYIDRIPFDERLAAQMIAEWNKYKDYTKARGFTTVLKREISDFVAKSKPSLKKN
jgi:hypothetical protein